MLRNFGNFRLKKIRSYPGQQMLPNGLDPKADPKPETAHRKSKKRAKPIKPSKLYYKRIALEAEIDSQPPKERENVARLIRRRK